MTYDLRIKTCLVKIFLPSLFLCLCILPASSLAQTQTLDPVTVTASRAIQKVSETGRSISIIDSTMLKQFSGQSLDEVLKFAGGAEIQQRGPAGSQADIVLRGGTFQQVLVLMDGMRINDPITGHFSGYMPVLAEQIERIEILKGPAAAAYGSEAVGGVINIITKTAVANAPRKRNGNFRISAGEYGYLSSAISLQESKQRITYSVGAQTTNADGPYLRGNNRGYFHNHLFSGNLAIRLKNNWRIGLQTSRDMRDFAAQNFYTVLVSDTATEKVNTWWNHLKIAKEKARSSHHLDITWKNTFDDYKFNPGAVANENVSNNINLQYLFAKNNSRSFNYRLGVHAELKGIRSNDRGDHQNKSIAGFGMLYAKHKNLHTNAGMRLVHDENFGTEVLPQAGIALHLQKFVFRAHAGRSVRSADFTERYNNYNKSIVNGGNIGNPALVAERSWSYETGLDFTHKWMRFSATGFYRSQRELIDWVLTPYDEMPRPENLNPAGSFALARNISKLNTRGVELEWVVRKQFRQHSVSFNTLALFQKTDTRAGEPSFYILSHARTLFQQSLNWQYHGLSIGLSGVYKERNPQEASAIDARLNSSYFIMNARAGFTYKRFNVYYQVQNLGNVTYSDLLGSRMPGSWSVFGTEIGF